MLTLTEEQKLAIQVKLIREQLQQKKKVLAPTTYGLPVIHFPQLPDEPDDEFRLRRERAIVDVVENRLFFVKDGAKKQIKLIPEQIRFLTDFVYGYVNKGIIWKSRGGGGSLCAAIMIWLCVRRGTPILTPNGLVEIEKIQPGDIVLDGAGNWSTVRGKSSKHYEGRFIGLDYAGMYAPVWLTPEHRVWVERNSIWEWREAKELVVGDKVMQPKANFEPVGSITIEDDRASQPRSVATDGIFGRFLGYWLADGHLDKDAVALSCGQGDKAIIADYCALVHALWGRKPYIDTPKIGRMVRIRFGHRGLGRYLRTCYRDGHKRIPEALMLKASGVFASGLLTGWLRSDGSITRNKGPSNSHSVSIVGATTSPYLAGQIQVLAVSLGLAPGLSRAENSGSLLVRTSAPKLIYRIRFGSLDAVELAKKVYPDYPLNKEHRFRRRCFVSVDGGVSTAITKIFHESVADDVYDLNIDGDSSFCTPLCRVHNCMVYNSKGFVDLAGSSDQAKQVYNYTVQFWDAVPGLKDKFLTDKPLQSSTVTRTGAKLICVSCSQKAVRGKHESGLVLDESCQENDAGGDVFRAAMQGPMSEDDHTILLLSTFHHPFGFFADHWDNAEELGFTRYKWDIYNTMEQCTAQCDCMTECPLTRLEEIRDFSGRKIGTELVGCCGKARKNRHGYMDRKRVLEIMKMNLGTDVYPVEYECHRPGGARKVIPEAAITAATTREIEMPEMPPDDQPTREKVCKEQGIPFVPPVRACVGIDWGFAGQLAVVLIVRCDDYMAILDSRFMTGVLTEEVMRQLRAWEDEYQFIPRVYADASHPFNNAELANNGWAVMPVQFKQYKELGYQNLQKYFAHRKIRLIADKTILLREQLKRLRRGADGKIVKKDDHGPDSLMSFIDPKIPIMTPGGWIPVGELAAGSLVLTHKGRFRKITRYEPAPYGRGQVVLHVRGRTSEADAFRTTLEHPYLRADGRWVEAENIAKGDSVMFLATRCKDCGCWIPYFVERCGAKCTNETSCIMANQFLPIEVASVEILPTRQPCIAYHFEVEEDKSYVARGIVSHNCAMLNFPILSEFPEVTVVEESMMSRKKSKENDQSCIVLGG